MEKRSIIGIVIIAVGLLALAGTFGYVDTDGMFSTFWPVSLILVGLLNLSDKHKSKLFGGTITILGVIFLLRNLGFDVFEKVRFWEMFWPVVIILAGIWLITSKGIIRPYGKRDVSDDEISEFALFSGSDTVNCSQDFRGGNITAMFGGVELDLRGTVVKRPPAKIEVFVMFGGAEIKVPTDWKVKVTGLPIFGGWSNKTKSTKSMEAENELVVNCFALFGGFEVKN